MWGINIISFKKILDVTNAVYCDETCAMFNNEKCENSSFLHKIPVVKYVIDKLKTRSGALKTILSQLEEETIHEYNSKQNTCNKKDNNETYVVDKSILKYIKDQINDVTSLFKGQFMTHENHHNKDIFEPQCKNLIMEHRNIIIKKINTINHRYEKIRYVEKYIEYIKLLQLHGYKYFETSHIKTLKHRLKNLKSNLCVNNLNELYNVPEYHIQKLSRSYQQIYKKLHQYMEYIKSSFSQKKCICNIIFWVLEVHRVINLLNNCFKRQHIYINNHNNTIDAFNLIKQQIANQIVGLQNRQLENNITILKPNLLNRYRHTRKVYRNTVFLRFENLILENQIKKHRFSIYQIHQLLEKQLNSILNDYQQEIKYLQFQKDKQSVIKNQYIKILLEYRLPSIKVIWFNYNNKSYNFKHYCDLKHKQSLLQK